MNWGRAALACRQRLNEQVVHDIWAEIDEGSRFGAIFRQSVERATFGADAPKTDVWCALSSSSCCEVR